MGYWKKHGILLGLIVTVAVGAAVRFYRIGEIPYGYAYDEAGITYDAWSISLWHRDQFANFMPFSFRSFGDHKPPFLIYLLAGIFSATGLNEVTIRLVSALAGVGSILMTNWLAQALFEKENRKKAQLVGLFAASIVALSPWSIQLSRVGFEQNLAFFLGATGLYFLIKGFIKPQLWLFSGLFLAGSIYTFHTAKIFIPLSLLLVGVFYWRDIWRVKKWATLALLTIIILLGPFLYSSIKEQSNMRANTLIFYGESGALQTVDKIGNELWVNLLHQLSPAFWVSGWDATSIRHAVPGFGVLLWPMYIVLVMSIIWIVIYKRDKISLLLLGLWFAGLAPALLSHTTPHVIRSQFALISTAILIGYGLVYFFMWLSSRRIKILSVSLATALSLATLWQFRYYLMTYFGTYAQESATAFQYGYKEAISRINMNIQANETVFVTSSYQQPYIYLLLYNRITPQNFQFGGLNQYKIMPINWRENQEKGLFLATPMEIPPSDPLVIDVITIPNSSEPVLVIARNP